MSMEAKLVKLGHKNSTLLINSNFNNSGKVHVSEKTYPGVNVVIVDDVDLNSLYVEGSNIDVYIRDANIQFLSIDNTSIVDVKRSSIVEVESEEIEEFLRDMKTLPVLGKFLNVFEFGKF